MPLISLGLGLALLASQAVAQVRPPEPFVDRGLCPFECCTYGEWTAVDAIPVYRHEGRARQPISTLGPGTRFQAVTGDVHLARAGIVVALDTVFLRAIEDSLPPARFRRGDSIYVLTYLGEGEYHFWHQGRVRQSYGFWPEPGEDTIRFPFSFRGKMLHRPEEQWWVQIRQRNGLAGWILMDGVQVDGHDACS